MNWFSITLAITTLIRGFGAGLIYDVAIVSLPVRRRIGVIPYVRYAIANFSVRGLKTYGPVSILGAVLTIAITISAFVLSEKPIVLWSITTALIATILAFLGTFRALPAILSLRHAPEEEAMLTKLLDQFAVWHTFSTVWQIISFIALVVAMVGLP